MTVGRRSYSTLASFLSLYFKFVNDFTKISENASVQNAPFQVSHNMRHQNCPCLGNSCTDLRTLFCSVSRMGRSPHIVVTVLQSKVMDQLKNLFNL
jgi:hypothetical protein